MIRASLVPNPEIVIGICVKLRRIGMNNTSSLKGTLMDKDLNIKK